MQTDVLILGAGPAGSSLALRLARAGYAVVLTDRKAFPRSKPCGEFLSPQCTPLLRELGVHDELTARSPWLVRGMHMHHGERHALGRFRQLLGVGAHGRAGLGIRREVLDDLLLRGATAEGATFRPRCQFAGLLRDDAGRVVGAQLRTGRDAPQPCRARWVVGADGVHSAVARELGVQRRTAWLDRFALATHFEDVAASPFAEVHLLRDGFFAATSVDADLFSVNLIVPRAALRQRSSPDWDAFVADHFGGAPAMGRRLAGARRVTPWRGIGPMAYATTAQWLPGAALVGDACGYVDPLTGEGIYFALFGARALACGLQAAMATPAAEAAAMATYVTARRREIVPRLRASTLLQRALRHPWLASAFVRQAARWPALADLAVTLTGDTVHPRDLCSPKFWRDFHGAAVA